MNNNFTLALVVPVFNEQDNILPLYNKLKESLSSYKWNIWFVDDGSSDKTNKVILDLSYDYNNVTLISLTRNFGHMAALTAGIDIAEGDVLITLDGDMQHPPELIPEMIKLWQADAKIVQGIRSEYEKATIFKKLSSKIFYMIFRFFTKIDLESNAADFRLLDKEVVYALRQFKERDKFLRGLIWWTGYSRKLICFNAPERLHGKTKYSTKKMIDFAIKAIVSFSSFPLKLIFLAGILIIGFVGVYSLYGLFIYIFTNKAQPGWLSLLLATMFFNGVVLISLGIIGQYMSVIYDEIKERPVYLIKNNDL